MRIGAFRCLQAPLGDRRRADVGQPLHDAPGHAVRTDRAPRYAPDDDLDFAARLGRRGNRPRASQFICATSLLHLLTPVIGTDPYVVDTAGILGSNGPVF